VCHAAIRRFTGGKRLIRQAGQPPDFGILFLVGAEFQSLALEFPYQRLRLRPVGGSLLRGQQFIHLLLQIDDLLLELLVLFLQRLHALGVVGRRRAAPLGGGVLLGRLVRGRVVDRFVHCCSFRNSGPV